MEICLQWKQQHLNNSCAQACLAMLLSHWGIDTQDSELIGKSIIPYLIAYDEEARCLSAGMLVQSTAVFNVLSQPYGLAFHELCAQDWAAYVQEAENLLRSHQPFMTGISVHSLPTTSPEALLRPDHGHAIVIYAQDAHTWHGFDPAADLERTRDYLFDEVRERVTVVLPYAAFQQGIIQKPGVRFLLSTLLPMSAPAFPDLNPFLYQSRQALTVFYDVMQEFYQRLLSPGGLTYPKFLEYRDRYLKALVIDFRIALEQINPKTALQQQLCQRLGKLQISIQAQQSQLQMEHPLAPDRVHEFCDDVAAIYELVLEHLESCSLVVS